MDAKTALEIVARTKPCPNAICGGDRCSCRSELSQNAVQVAEVLAAEVLELEKHCGDLYAEAEGLRLKRLEVLFVLSTWGGNEEAHHLRWVVDQVARRALGDEYAKWVAEMCAGDDGPNTYTWDEGIAP